MSLSAQMESDGLSDKPSIIYGFEGANDESEIRELVRSGYGEPGPSPGDVIARSRSDSNPDTSLPSGDLPQDDELAHDDCGDPILSHACDSCGDPTKVDRTCGNPRCYRCWASAIKGQTKRLCGKLEGLRKVLRYRSDQNIIFNHVVASLPTFKTDSDDPKQTFERALDILKTLLKEQFGIDNFVSIYHEYRIKDEYRGDLLVDHGGAEGQGDMSWSDVLDKPDSERDKYLKFEPHFHLFFCTNHGGIDYNVCEYLENQTGWLIHRVEKPEEDDHRSVADLDDLVRQIMYCLSHCMINEWHADRQEFTTRLKGEIHNDIHAPEGVEDDIISSFCDYSQTLLGVNFTQHSGDCNAVLPDAESEVQDLYPSESGDNNILSGGNPSSDVLDAGVGRSDRSDDLLQSGDRPTGSPSVSADLADRERCDGRVRPIKEVAPRLDDAEWVEQAEYAAGLRRAVEEWRANDSPEMDDILPD